MVSFTRDDISYEQFENFPIEYPLEHGWVPEYVVMADAVSFYEYIDHDRLEHEIVGLTGLAGIAEGLIDLLEIWMGASRGIPQGPTASESLADIYIAPASRALLRAGFEHSRYSDDFRIPAASWVDVRSVQGLLEDALRSVGLVISIPKLRTPTIERYLTYFDLIPELEEGEQDELEWMTGDYSGTEEQVSPPTADELAKAEQSFNDSIVVLGPDLVDTRRMKRCLPWLAAGGSPLPLENIGKFLDRYAHVTQEFVSYLKQMMQTELENQAVTSILTWLTQPQFKYAWQVGWLLHGLAGADGTYAELAEASQGLLFDDSMPWFVRGQAAIVCAAQGKLPAHRRFIDVYERSPRATRPDLVAAVVIQQPTWSPSFLAAAPISPVLRDISQFDPGQFREWL